MFPTFKTKSKLTNYQPSTGLANYLKFISFLILATSILAILQIILLNLNDGKLEKNRERPIHHRHQEPVEVQVRQMINSTTGSSLLILDQQNTDKDNWRTLEDTDTISISRIGKLRAPELFDLNTLHPSPSKSIIRVRRHLSSNSSSTHTRPLELPIVVEEKAVNSTDQSAQTASVSEKQIESQIEPPEEIGNRASGSEKYFATYDQAALPEPTYRGEYGSELESIHDKDAHDREGPSLAELIAAGTAVGLQLSRLNAVNEDQPDSSLYKRVSGLYSSYRNRELDQPLKRENDAHLDISETIPESLESLVQSKDGGESSFTYPNVENQPAASNLVAEDSDAPSNIDEASAQVNLKLQYQPSHSSDQSAAPSRRQKDYGQEGPIYAGPVVGEVMLGKSHLVVPIHDSSTDLNTAAGHYYGKKKYKKVIKKKKKKKKKIIVKKKVKKVKKKIKKYKIKKYKVKKYKVKKYKKKPKKHYHHHGGHHGGHHDHGKYYMYAKVPKKKSWEFGFKKGNKKHWIERHEKGHKNKFKTKVKWYDAKSKGKGIHVWDYNHHDKKKKHHA